ncbi:cytochrome p450 [Apiospora phragmitis]|uniref:Cytochrome p450 n=1 Tax=Apiospora phragmitis TaxID=2905665 RepID=A0ABR1VQ67_9PEZI
MPNLQLLGNVKPAHLGLALMIAASALGLLYVLAVKPIYNLLLHPLPQVPGPQALGRQPPALHLQYGADIVRVAPDELSFLRPDAWREVMGYIPRGVPENEKDPLIFRGLNVEDSVIGAPRDRHRVMRAMLSHGFSASRMLDQQPIIMRYIDLLVERLREKAVVDRGIPLNMVLWYNYATFDIIGDLAFGEAFGCLESAALHPWVAVVFSWIKLNARVVQYRRTVPWLGDLIDSVLGRMATEQVKEHMGYARLRRLDAAHRQGRPVPDAQPARGEREPVHRRGLRDHGVDPVVRVVPAAHPPDKMQKVTDELFATFARDDEINFNSVQSLKYMIAMFEEALRIFPPVPVTVPRVTPPGGRQICGDHIPENTKLGIWHYSMYHHPGNFALPEEFHPERWLGEDPRFAHDRKEAFEPFSHGSRNCLGKNLAYAEMRTIMARMLFNFDMRLADGYERWADGIQIHNLFEKSPLFIHLTPRGDHERAHLRSKH